MASTMLDAVNYPTLFTAKDTLNTSMTSFYSGADTNCDVFGAVGNLVDAVGGAISATLQEAYQNMMKYVSDAWDSITSWFGKMWDNSIIDDVATTLQDFISSVESAIGSFMSTVEGLIDDLGNAVSSMIATTCSAVTGAINSLSASVVGQVPVLQAAQANPGDPTTAGGQSLVSSGAEAKVGTIVSASDSVKSNTGWANVKLTKYSAVQTS